MASDVGPGAEPSGHQTVRKPIERTMEFDDLLKTLGEFGRFQKVMIALLCVVGLPAGINILSNVFLVAEPPFRCVVPSAEHLNLSWDEYFMLTAPPDAQTSTCSRQCEKYTANYTDRMVQNVSEVSSSVLHANMTTVKCQDGWVYDNSTYTSTIVTEWNLVCDWQPLVPTASSIYMAGLLVGVSAFGAISDWFGRKASMVPAAIIMVIFAIAPSFSPNYITFVSLRFVLAAATIGLSTTGFVMAVELVGPSWRVFAGTVGNYFWVASYLVVAAVGYGIRDWRHFSLALSVPQVLLIAIVLILPESPRWLYSRNKHQRADTVIRRMAKFNKVDLPEVVNVQIQRKTQAYVLDLFRYPKLRLRTLNICFNWFVNSLVYYGLTLNTGNLGGNDYLNFMWSGLVEVPANVLAQLGMHYFGRKKSLVSTMVAAGAFLLAIVAIPKAEHHCGVPVEDIPPAWHDLRVLFAMLGKLCISASYTVIYVFSAELFPTVVRNVGVSTGSVCARIGGSIAPYILSVMSDAPYIVFGLMSIIAGLLSLLLPETKGQQLPETIEDGEHFPRCKTMGEENSEVRPQQASSVHVVGSSSPENTDRTLSYESII